MVERAIELVREYLRLLVGAWLVSTMMATAACMEAVELHSWLVLFFSGCVLLGSALNAVLAYSTRKGV